MPDKVGAFDEFFLARQPILDREQELVAFELLFRHAGKGDAVVTDNAVATASVIAHAAQLGMEQVVGERLAFLNVDGAVLESDFVRFLPHKRVILEILETVVPTPAILARIAELKGLGFVFALDDVVADTPDVRQLVALVDVIKIDLRGVEPGALLALVRRFKGPGKKLLAEKVETIAEFKTCLDLGFDYFQGYYFARPVILSGKKLAPSELVILNLLDLINSDADTEQIERAVKRDAMISLNLLRLVNTAASGVRQRIDSVSQAVMVLGRRQLQRWLQILMYSKPGAKVQVGSPLLQLASTRGKLLELLTRASMPGKAAAADTGFTVGIMSLMDALFSMPMAEVLQTVDVPDEVRHALLERGGPYGRMLRLVEILENPVEGAPLGELMQELGLTVGQVRDIELQAYEWINELNSELGS